MQMIAEQSEADLLKCIYSVAVCLVKDKAVKLKDWARNSTLACNGSETWNALIIVTGK